MLSLAFINMLFVNSRQRTIAISLCLALGFSGCSSSPALTDESIAETESDADLLDNSKQGDENELSESESSENKQSEAENKLLQEQENIVPVVREPAKNLYLEQQAQVPVVVSKQIANDYENALALMKEKKWSEAEVLLDQIILAEPNLSGSYVNKAIIAKEQAALDEAQKLLSKAIEVNKLNLYAHHLQGQVFRLQGEFAQAENSYLAAIAIWTDYAEAYASMGVLLELYRGRLLEAYGYYHTYLLLKPDDIEVKRWQAGLAIKLKRAGLEIPVIEESPITKKAVDEEASDTKIDSNVEKNTDQREIESDKPLRANIEETNGE